MNQTEFQVLLVENDQEMSEALSQVLEQENIVQRVVPDVHHALKIMREIALDLVLLDLSLPDEDGFALLRHMQEDPGIIKAPVVILTGSESLKDKMLAFELGAADYIVK